MQEIFRNEHFLSVLIPPQKRTLSYLRTDFRPYRVMQERFSLPPLVLTASMKGLSVTTPAGTIASDLGRKWLTMTSLPNTFEWGKVCIRPEIANVRCESIDDAFEKQAGLFYDQPFSARPQIGIGTQGLAVYSLRDIMLTLAVEREEAKSIVEGPYLYANFSPEKKMSFDVGNDVYVFLSARRSSQPHTLPYLVIPYRDSRFAAESHQTISPYTCTIFLDV